MTFVRSMTAPASRRAGVLSALLLVATLGCGGGVTPPPATDADSARTALVEALDAWRGGRTIESLREGSSPLYVADEEWRAGRKLEAYEIIGAPAPHGLTMRFNVRLKLAPAPGARTPASAPPVRYVVTTQPARNVSRDDSDL
jgi:hypothetical protein